MEALAVSAGLLRRLATLPLWHDGVIRGLLVGAVAANLSIFGYVAANYSSLPPFLPLHYSASGEVDRLGTPTEVYLMPSIGAFVLLCNVVFSAAIYRREPLASHLFAAASIIVQLLLLYATIQIVSHA